MLMFILLVCFLTGFSLAVGLFPLEWEVRPTLQAFGYETKATQKKKTPATFLKAIAMINKPLVSGPLRQRIAKDLAMAHVRTTPEEFFLFKEALIVGTLILSYPMIQPDMVPFWILMSVAVGYMLPEFLVKNKIKKVKSTITKELPDAIDLLGLCVNAGLDFMLALKWVVEKSTPSVMVDELNILLQEINVGKTRRDALKDLSTKFDIPDLSTFTRTLLQADKMGTSVSEALSLLSEDMRLARFRRGEQVAMKAPMKLLVPLLFFIFPVVGILVAGPIFLEFVETNPLQSLGG
ncbi:MAG: type II secretion system F family protein [Candidatus Omnitrophica bacterium]|nr:type II secretion system F family protein [Candidatus Omnitrophota bacterium]